ncbi:MAG: WhiB family transcriptional regulator [Acidimicrobiales bacterium]
MFAPQIHRNPITQTRADAEPTPGLFVKSDWWQHARCRDLTGAMVGLFFSEELGDIAKAKMICAQCPVLADCLEGAMERREPWGVWGGQLFRNGRILAQKRRRGRPPKNPRPGDVLPEVPIPEHLRTA